MISGKTMMLRAGTLTSIGECTYGVLLQGLIFNGTLTRNHYRADFRVLPLLLIGFAGYQLDRTNIGSALTGDFAVAVSVDQNTINIGNQLMFLGVIILEIPSNMMLHKVASTRPLE